MTAEDFDFYRRMPGDPPSWNQVPPKEVASLCEDCYEFADFFKPRLNFLLSIEGERAVVRLSMLTGLDGTGRPDAILNLTLHGRQKSLSSLIGKASGREGEGTIGLRSVLDEEDISGKIGPALRFLAQKTEGGSRFAVYVPEMIPKNGWILDLYGRFCGNLTYTFPYNGEDATRLDAIHRTTVFPGRSPFALPACTVLRTLPPKGYDSTGYKIPESKSEEKYRAEHLSYRRGEPTNSLDEWVVKCIRDGKLREVLSQLDRPALPQETMIDRLNRLAPDALLTDAKRKLVEGITVRALEEQDKLLRRFQKQSRNRLNASYFGFGRFLAESSGYPENFDSGNNLTLPQVLANIEVLRRASS